MSTILAPLDSEDAHTIALLGLLKLLKARGHRVCCLGPPKVQDLVRRENVEFIAFRVSREALFDKITGLLVGDEWELRLLLQGAVDEIITQLNPDLVLVNSQRYVEGLVIYYRYRLPIIFYDSSFRFTSREEFYENTTIGRLTTYNTGVPELLDLLTKSGAQFSNFKEIAHLLMGFPELLLSPEAFEFPGQVAEPGVYYIGAWGDLSRSEEPFNWNYIDPERTLIYCALGSQSDGNKEMSYRMVQIVLDIAMGRPEWQFIIAIGKGLDPGKLAPSPTNAIITPWAPQLEVLRRADVMINHAGFNTIRECIMMGVPMLVFPMRKDRDHEQCAECVVHHGLGLQLDIEQVTSNKLCSHIECLIENQSFKERLSIMREKFVQQNRPEIGIRVIEDVISSSAQSVLRG